MSRTYSQYSYFNTVIFSPVAPSGLRLDQVGNTVAISWLDNSTYEDGFIIERKTSSGSWRKIYFVDEKKDFFTDYGPFTNGETYYYRVSSYIILPNQKYLISDASTEANLIIILTTASVDAESIVEIEFSSTSSISLDLKEKVRVYVKDAVESVDYLWFSNSSSFSVAGHGEYADIFAVGIGSGTVKVKKRDNSGEAILNITVTREVIEDNPAQVNNLRARALTNSSLEILWNYDSDPDIPISHFEIYRIKRISSSSAGLLVVPGETTNRVGVVAFDSLESVYNFYDYGLESGQSYVYTVVAISKYNISSMYDKGDLYDYVVNKQYVISATVESDIEIKPTLAYVSVGGSLYLGIYNPQDKTLSNITWEIEQNESGSILRSDDEEVTYFEASDKSISQDDIKVQADSDIARARVIVTETI